MAAAMGKLEVKVIVKFLKDQSFPAARATELGVGLGISMADLESIKADHSSPNVTLIEVIQYWLNDDPNQSWSKLAYALESCGFLSAANTITGGKTYPPSNEGGGPTFDLGSLSLLKWTNQRGEEQSLKILHEVCNSWKVIADMIGVPFAEAETIETQNHHNPQACCRAVFEEWIREGKRGGHYEANWDGMLTLLQDIQHGRVAKCLKEALESLKKQVHSQPLII